MGKKRLGEVLRERNAISDDDLKKFLLEAQKRGIPLGELLSQRGAVSKERLAPALEEVTRFPYLDARAVTIDKALLEIIPYSVAMRYCVLPVVRDGKKMTVLMADPQNVHTVDELRFLCGTEISPRLGFRPEILDAIKKWYAEAPEQSAKLSFIEEVDAADIQFLTGSAEEKNQADLDDFLAQLRQDSTPAVRLTTALIAAAAAKAASDIHIEPQPLDTVVRIRVDGVLRELTRIPNQFQPSLISRIKILGDMDIAERRQPQDGHFLVRVGSRSLEIRVSTLPTRFGEKAVLRLLDQTASQVTFADLGVTGANAEKLLDGISRPQGMVLVTGPTGSGKTTLLYTAINTIRSPHINVVTVEDPIESKIAGATQVQINPQAGLTFANCLRAILRQDPNVIMVGEIRDRETAEIALGAAQTGHLVFSTLHTNDSISAVIRLLDLDIPAFLIVSSVTAVIAQRLVRKLCSCRKQVPLTREWASRLQAVGVENLPDALYVPAGCDVCDYTGYKGRTGIYEVLVFDDEIREYIRDKACVQQIRQLARKRGIRRMQDDAVEKMMLGITTLEEVLRVVPFEDASAATDCWKCKKALPPASLFCSYCGAETRSVSPLAPAACSTVLEGGVLA